MMDISIIVVNWNTRDLLATCLESILSTSGSDVGPYLSHGTFILDVLVVDNASSDGSIQMVRERFPWVRLIANSENIGFAPANNQAIRHSQARYVLLLNSDTQVCPGALGQMVRFMDEHPGAGGCGPLLLNPDGSLQPSCHPMLTPGREFWRLMFLDKLWRRATYAQEGWDREAPRRVEVVKGACFLLRRAALDQVGLLDETYFMYTEEVDICLRLTLAGWQLWWVPQAVVKHYGEASSRQMAEPMYVQLYRSKIQFYRKFGGARWADRFKQLLRLAYGLRWLVFTLAAPASEKIAVRARVYRRLLTELADM